MLKFGAQAALHSGEWIQKMINSPQFSDAWILFFFPNQSAAVDFPESSNSSSMHSVELSWLHLGGNGRKCVCSPLTLPSFLTSTPPTSHPSRGDGSYSDRKTEGSVLSNVCCTLRSWDRTTKGQCFVSLLSLIFEHHNLEALKPDGNCYSKIPLRCCKIPLRCCQQLHDGFVFRPGKSSYFLHLCSHCRVIMLCYHTILGLPKGPAKTLPQVTCMIM